MPPRWAYRQFLHALDVDKAFEPAQQALLTIMAKWLSTLTIEERKRVRGMSVTFDAINGDTMTARLLTWEQDDAADHSADTTGADASPEPVPDGAGVCA